MKRSRGDDSDLPDLLTVGKSELLIDGSDAAFREFVHDLLAFGARLRDIRDSLAALCGLSGSAYTVLISIARLEQDGPVNITSLAQHLKVSQPFVTTEVAKLVDAGLVDKRRSHEDGRVMVLATTESGRRRLADLAPEQRVINDRLFGSVDAGTFEILRHAIAQLVLDADESLAMARQVIDEKKVDVA